MPIQDGMINLYSFVQGNPPQRTIKYAGGFKPEWNGEVLFVIDWKIVGEQVRLTYQTKQDNYGPIFDQDFPLVSQTFLVSKPDKSRFWQWNDYNSQWFNKRTGQRIPVH